MCEGWLSLDQVGVIAEHAADGSDEHYAELAASATVRQLRTAVKLEPRPEPETRPEPERFISRTEADEHITWRIRLPRLDAAKLDTALQTHHDAVVTDWRRDHGIDGEGEQAPPFPDLVDAFMSLVEAGWDTEAARRPHGLHTTVAVHLNVTDRIAALHLGPVLSEDDRRYLLCDATCEVWFERQGQPVGVGRTPARSAGGCAAPSNTATGAVWSRAVAPPVDCMPITSCIGKTAAPPTWTTSCWSARITTGCITGAASPSPARPTN